MKPVAAYVTVTDMTRSIVFYSELFDKSPAHTESRYSYYDIDGFSFGLFYAAHDGQHITTGNNQVICFKVDNIENTYQRIKSIASTIDTDFLDTEHVRLFQFTDPDGNIIEIFEDK